MRELEMHEVELVSGGARDQESSAPWWHSFDYNGDGDLFDEARNWFLGAGAGLGIFAGGSFIASGGVSTPVSAAAGAGAAISGGIGGAFALADYYFGNEAPDKNEN